jgi:DHA1 family bicyclomycin/chloramphenicol resistance-like MFS transporter
MTTRALGLTLLEILPTTPPEHLESRMGRREFIVLISMLMALTALAIDMMLPAFGQIRADFGLAVDSNAVARIVTVFFLGIGLGQLVWGPLADALGRKRVLWLGLSIYIVGAIGGALSPSLEVLLLWRFVAGLGAAGVRVVTLGTVRDRYRGDQMAKVLSYIMAIFILVPMIAPSLGSIVLVFGTWRWVFAFFALAAALMAAWSLRLPESLPPERRIPPDPRRLVGAGRYVLGSRFTMGFTLAQTAMFGFFASYHASTQLIVDDVFGLAEWFPLIFGGASIAYGAATLLNPRLIDRFGLRRMVRYAVVGHLLAAGLLAGIAIASGGHPPFVLYMVGIVLMLLMHALTMPNLNSAAMMPMGRVAGTAAAVIGALTTLVGAALGAVVDSFYDGSVTPLAIAAVTLSAVALALARWADAVWERDAERQLLTPEEQAEAAAAVPVEVA